MILLWGLPGDRPLIAVHTMLQQLGYPVVLLDQRAVLRTEVELCVGSHIEGTLWFREQTISLNTVSAVYLRPYDSRRLPDIVLAGQDSPAWRFALEVEDILMSWVELTPALVVNRPTAMAINSSKPFQSILIRSLGFEIPDTLITTDPDAALEFWKRHDTVIYKSVSGIRSIVSRLTTEHLEHLGDVTWCPTQFQEYIPGTDYRVHIVGKEVYTCKILSNADDYRYAARQGGGIVIQPDTLPEEVANRCKMLVASMNLSVAGIDLRRSHNDQWYCFEVNPSPGFSYFQEAANQPIDEAIARLLASAVE